GYYLCWVWFGLGGLFLNIACVPLLLLPNPERYGPQARRTTRWMFNFWVRWLHFSDIVPAKWLGFDRPLGTGTIYVANHPCLLDAPILLGRLPDTVCIIKPALLRNPCTGPTARMCGFVSAGENGVDLIRNSADRIIAGQSLLIFPEGTRTEPGVKLNPLKPGFAMIARRAGCPVQLIRIRSGPKLARKGNPWWRVPPLPCWIELTLDELIPAEEIGDPLEFTARIAARFNTILPPADPNA
ncbi:MAG: lysophospholipid acyltransferase family protein, partial [Rariglobus sp.]